MKDFGKKEWQVSGGRGGSVRVEYRERRDGRRAQVVVNRLPLEEGLPKQMRRRYHSLIAAQYRQGRPLGVTSQSQIRTRNAGRGQRHQGVAMVQNDDTQGYTSLAEIKAFYHVSPALFPVDTRLTPQRKKNFCLFAGSRLFIRRASTPLYGRRNCPPRTCGISTAWIQRGKWRWGLAMT